MGQPDRYPTGPTLTPPALSEIQRWLRALIAAPEGVGAALAELGEPAARALENCVRSDATLSAVQRLDVYANAYFYRIRDCLEDDFRALRAVIGEAPFHNLVTAYLVAHPPRHPSLRYAGDRLANFVAEHPDCVPAGRRWLADLARLEWALLDAFDAADCRVVAREELAAIDPQRWGELRFDFQPALALLRLAFPAQRVRLAWDRGESAGAAASELDRIGPGAHAVLVWRREERVSYRELDRLESLSLDAASAGETFGSLCERLASEVGDSDAPQTAASLLARWQADGLLAGFRLDRG